MENALRTGFGPARGNAHNLARWRWIIAFVSPIQLSPHYRHIFALARGFLRDGLPLRWRTFLDSWWRLVRADHFPDVAELADLRHLRWTDVDLPVSPVWFAMRDHLTTIRPSASHLHSIWGQCSTAGIPLAGGALWERRLQPALPAAEWGTFWPRLALLYPRDPAAANSFHLFQLGYLHRAVYQVSSLFFPDRPWLHDVAVSPCLLCTASACGQPDHLFFSCPVSGLVWTTVAARLGLPAPPPLSAELLAACRPPTNLRHAVLTVHIVWTTYLRRRRSPRAPRPHSPNFWMRLVSRVLTTRHFLALWE
ncbi:hypothetical protein V1509DRAFT_621040 [Lipomyces kononenkoae]